ncbi:hypothetical protein BRADI_4g25101v3 [Brachypodium distachyon]|uniref:Uncharacterized protein n=1 Tax=Brachypodium distachyon TaxID=15368 RepID=A0A0Q3PJ03_BRADI|nr:hypothetical protein BRADI_4g25101v3 [Brachypodium distachyon]
MDAETEAYYRDRRVDPWILELNLITALTCLHYTPQPNVDRISRLPDVLLERIVSRLPVKEGACTALLSRRWRGVWRVTSLVLADVDLLPTGPRGMLEVTPAESQAVASAEIPGLLVRWLHLHAINDVRELFLFNRPLPLNMQLPVGFFGIATLTRLYLGIFTFPNTAALPPAIQTPVLKTLCIQINIMLMCLHIISSSLRCVHIIGGTDLDVVLEDAPQLERLIMWSSCVCNGLPRKVKIGFAPALTVLGYLEPALHTLEIGNTVIKNGTRVSWSTMVPSVKILALSVCFGVHSNAKMMSSFRRCFPNVKRLHLESDHETVGPTCKLCVKFWQEGGAIEWAPNELSFLQYILERMLMKLVIVFSKGSFTSKTKGNKKLKPLFAGKWANKDCSLVPVESEVKDDRHPALGLENRRLLNLEGI